MPQEEYPSLTPRSEAILASTASLDTADDLLQSLNGDILASISAMKEPSITEGVSDSDPSLDTDSFLTDLGFKDRAPLMLFDEKTKHYYRQWKAVFSTRRGCEGIVLFLNVMLSLTVVIKYSPWPAEIVWPLFLIDVVILSLNMVYFTYVRLLSWLPCNCHAIIDTRAVISQSKVFAQAHTWSQRIATFLWHQRHYIGAVKLFVEVLAMMILFAEQTFASGTCTRSDLRNAVTQLYWLACNFEGGVEATSIFTAFRILLHPFVYGVIGWTEFESTMAIFVMCMMFLLICNLLTPSLAFLHPTLVYGALIGVALASAERSRRLVYLKELRQRHLEVRRCAPRYVAAPPDCLFLACPFSATSSSFSSSSSSCSSL